MCKKAGRVCHREQAKRSSITLGPLLEFLLWLSSVMDCGEDVEDKPFPYLAAFDRGLYHNNRKQRRQMSLVQVISLGLILSQFCGRHYIQDFGIVILIKHQLQFRYTIIYFLAK